MDNAANVGADHPNNSCITKKFVTRKITAQDFNGERAISDMKKSMLYFRKDNRCYAVVFYRSYSGTAATMTYIPCTDDIQ